MAQITISEDCGNAPKKQFIQDFCIALANANIAAAMDMLAERPSPPWDGLFLWYTKQSTGFKKTTLK